MPSAARSLVASNSPAVSDAALVTTATLRAADLLGVTGKDLARIVGISPAFVSKLRAGAVLPADGKPGELALHFLRLFRALDAITGGDETAARAWMRTENTALGARPIEHIQSIAGLIDACTYLDQRRAVL